MPKRQNGKRYSIASDTYKGHSLILEQAIEEVKAKLGEDSITTDDDELHRHGYSEWSTINIDVLPIAVVYPKSTAEVSEIAKVCYAHKIPIGKQGFTMILMGYTYRINSSLFWRFKSRRQFLGSVWWFLCRFCVYG
jgi:hypothetical protein